MNKVSAHPALGLKTTILNMARSCFKIQPLEDILRRVIRGHVPEHPLAKLPPNHYQYAHPSMRIANCEGINYELDISDLMQWSIYFKLRDIEREKLLELIKPGDLIFDIGTNVGEVLLNAARMTGPHGQVYGFEPDPLNLKRCLRNISLNSFKNASVSPEGLGQVVGKSRMVVASPRNRGGNRISESPAAESFTVKISTMDKFVEENLIEKLDLVKMDVEGFEHRVLKGGDLALKRFRPKMFLEIDDDNLRAQDSSAASLVAHIEGLGYKVFSARNRQPVSSGDDFRGCHYDIICLP